MVKNEPVSGQASGRAVGMADPGRIAAAAAAIALLGAMLLAPGCVELSRKDKTSAFGGPSKSTGGSASETPARSDNSKGEFQWR